MKEDNLLESSGSDPKREAGAEVAAGQSFNQESSDESQEKVAVCICMKAQCAFNVRLINTLSVAL